LQDHEHFKGRKKPPFLHNSISSLVKKRLWISREYLSSLICAKSVKCVIRFTLVHVTVAKSNTSNKVFQNGRFKGRKSHHFDHNIYQLTFFSCKNTLARLQISREERLSSSYVLRLST